MTEISKSHPKLALWTTVFALPTAIIGAFLLIYNNANFMSLGMFLFFMIMGIFDLLLLAKFKLIKSLNVFSIATIISYFVLTFGFIITTKDQFINFFILFFLFTLMNIALCTEVLREHLLIRSILGGVYYVGGKFIAFFEYITSLVDSIRFGNKVSKSGAVDFIKTGLIFAIIGIPVILIIVSLLSASNDQFAKAVNQLFDWHLNLGINFVRLIFIIFVSLYLVTDIFFLKVFERFEKQVEKNIDLSLGNTKNFLRAGVLTVIILNIFYLFFIFIDLGQDFTNARNLLISKGVSTYSEFAVGRFWELITISLINLVIFYAFTGFYKKLNPENSKILKPVVTTNLLILFINSLGLIVSVHQRLSLYESGYGFTDKRLLAHLFVFILVIIFALSLAALFNKEHSKLQLISVSIVLTFLCIYSALPTDYIANKLSYEMAKTGKIAVYDPTYAAGTHYCYSEDDEFFISNDFTSDDSLFVAKEILQENKVSLKPNDRICLEKALKAEANKGPQDWREFNLARYLLDQTISSYK